MANIFVAIFLLSIPATLVALVWPKAFARLGARFTSRGALMKVLLPIMFGSFIGVGVAAPPVPESTPIVQESAQVQQIDDNEETSAEVSAEETPATPDNINNTESEATPQRNSETTAIQVAEPAKTPEPSAQPDPKPTQPAPTNTAGTDQDAPATTTETTPTTVAAPAPAPSCSCGSNIYNCDDFSTHSEAQAVYNCCMAQVGYDVHKLDGNDNDGLACESLQ